MCLGSEPEERRQERWLGDAYHKELREISWEVIGHPGSVKFVPFLLIHTEFCWRIRLVIRIAKPY